MDALREQVGGLWTLLRAEKEVGGGVLGAEALGCCATGLQEADAAVKDIELDIRVSVPRAEAAAVQATLEPLRVQICELRAALGAARQRSERARLGAGAVTVDKTKDTNEK